MTSYPTKPTGNNIIDVDNIFASNNSNKIVMSTEEILDGYNNDGETETPLTSTPDGNKFNYFWYQIHNTLSWVIEYVSALFDNKLELSGGTMTGALAMGSNKITSSYAPVANIDLTNKLYVDTAVNGAWLLAEVKELAYVYSPTLPEGMEVVECDGRAISRTEYPELFSLMGTTWGSGDGSTTFNIPDKRGVVTRGWDHGRGLDTGRVFGSYQADNVIIPTTGWGTSGSAFGTGVSGKLVVASGFAEYGETLESLRNAGSNYTVSDARMKNTTGYFVIRIK